MLNIVPVSFTLYVFCARISGFESSLVKSANHSTTFWNMFHSSPCQFVAFNLAVLNSRRRLLTLRKQILMMEKRQRFEEKNEIGECRYLASAKARKATRTTPGRGRLWVESIDYSICTTR
jgi:hypothetical protein